MKYSLIALLLVGCASAPQRDDGPALEAMGFSPILLQPNERVQLVPCKKLVEKSHRPMSMDERVAYQKLNGGWFAACDNTNSETIWVWK